MQSCSVLAGTIGGCGGTADGSRLGWRAPASLLTSYEPERLPIGRFAAETSGAAGGRDGLLGLHHRAGLPVAHELVEPSYLKIVSTMISK